MSPDGARVAYVLKAPDVVSNQNVYELFVRDLGQTSSLENGRLLLQADDVSALQWLANSRALAVLSEDGKEMTVSLLDVGSGKREVIAGPARKIRSFGTDASGDVLVFSAGVRLKEDTALRQTRDLRGFSVIPGEPITQYQDLFPESELFLVKRGAGSKRETTRIRTLGLSTQPIEVFAGGVNRVSVSPDGRYVAFQYIPDTIPESWRSATFIQGVEANGFKSPAWGLVEIGTGQGRVAINAPATGYMPLAWAADSTAFAVSTLAPFGSSWEKQDLALGFRGVIGWSSYLHLFAVDVKTLSVSEVLPRYVGFNEETVSWERGDGDMVVPVGNGAVVRLKQVGGAWKQISRSASVDLEGSGTRDVIPNGRILIGIREDIQRPPDLFAYDPKTAHMKLLTDWNPEYHEISLGQVEKIHWTNKFGVQCEGQLIKPVGYEEGKKYPLVIVNAPSPGVFVSDGTYTTAFPPQPLASAGFFVLMAEYTLNDALLPKDFPGRIGEAYNWMAMVESGIDFLVKQGMTEKTKVVVIGFSRTSWKVDFMLTHSDFEFVAASSADGGLYNYGSYWLWNRANNTDSETMLGGPPYGETFSNWVEYAPSFNAQRVQAPLLMEYVGFGHQPNGPLAAYEFFTALRRQGKPVELYLYPKGDHPLDTPFERVASLQRNVDWFRFWMQGYEGTAPDYDPDQYVRWRKLRRLQAENDAKAAKEKPAPVN